MKINPILAVDSYKISHWLQYPPGTEELTNYIESRGGPGADPCVIFFGLQMLLMDKLTRRISEEEVYDAKKFSDKHIGPGIFPLEGWLYIVRELDGKLPVEISAVAEGTCVPSGNILVKIRSTDPKVFWVATWLETQLMRAVWYASTVASTSNRMKEIIYKSLLETSDIPDELIDTRLHDFSARGNTSSESAGIGSCAHLINFIGTDTIEGILYADRFYDSEMAGFSIPAAEHSTITSWGKEHEVDAYRNMLKQFAKPGSLVAVVSDSYDINNAVNNLWGKELKQEVIDSGATVIIRPDSGYPPDMVVNIAKSLDNSYGSTLNNKGYKVLNNNIRIIQGDGIDEGMLRLILIHTKKAGFATDNFAFGCGAGLVQKGIDRDTFR